MRILLTHRFFWPDTAPYALMLRSIGDALAEDGHDVHVFASKPSYRKGVGAPGRETLGKLAVRRVWVLQENRRFAPLRALNVVIYCFALFFHILRLRPDVVTASTFPPVLAAWFASLGARLTGGRFVYHMQDIHPEVSEIIGGALGRWPAAPLLRWLDNQTLRRAHRIVVLSEDMARTLRTRGLGDLPIRIINNFLLDDFTGDVSPPADLMKAPGKTRLIFAGNLGRFQNLDGLTDGIARCLAEDPDLELLFLGDGAVAADLKQKWGDHPQIRFGPFLPFAQARDLIADADIGLVSLIPGMCGVAYPSKVLTYLGLGVPVFVLAEADSDLGQSLRDGALGEAAEGYAPDDIARPLARLLANRPGRDQILAWYEGTASQAHAMRRWAEMLADLEGS